MAVFDYSVKCVGVFARYDADTLSWRKLQRSLTGEFIEFDEIWPRAGVEVGGQVYRLNLLADGRLPLPSASWPTLKAVEVDCSGTSIGCHGFNRIAPDGREWGMNLATAVQMWHTPSCREPGVRTERLVTKDGEPAKVGERAYDKETGRLAQTGLTQQVHMKELWPTLSTMEFEHKDITVTENGRRKHKDPNAKTPDHSVNLADAVQLWPTPRAGNPGSRRPGTGGKVLAEEAKKAQWPTPRAREGNAGLPGSAGSIHNQKKGYLDGVVNELQTETNVNTSQMQLNPAWAEWLMGFPLDWTVTD